MEQVNTNLWKNNIAVLLELACEEPVRDSEMDPSAVAGNTICGGSTVLHPFHHL
jgi:hypothetical protein